MPNFKFPAHIKEILQGEGRIGSCYRTLPSAISETFSLVSQFCNLFIIKKCEKRGKDLPILDEATCDIYLLVEFWLKSNVAIVI